MDIWQYVQPLDIDDLAKRFQTAKPFPSICIDNFLKPEFAEQVRQSFPTYDQAKELGLGFNAVNERGKIQVTDSSKFRGAVAQLHEVLASQPFLDLMSKMTGINELLADDKLLGGGLHQTGPRGHLDVHVDFNYIKERRLHRRMNIIIFLNPGWKKEWGGALELWDEQVKVCHHTFEPIFNRCCMFETSEISFHGVTAVTCPPNESRKSFAAYYYTLDETSNLDEISHSTIFRARPTERWKRWVAMPVERVGRSLVDGKNTIKRAIKKIVK